MITLGIVVDRHMADIESSYFASSNASALNSTGVLRSSSLLSAVGKRLDLYTPESLFFTSYLSNQMDFLISWIRRDENKEILSHLQRCKKVAFTLPEYLCHEYARKLQYTSEVPYIHVGKETYTVVGWMITLKGLWTKQFVNRYRTAYESGHGHKWTGLFTMNKIVRGSVYPVAAKLDGNIVIIFIVWILGLVVAILDFVVEVRKFILHKPNL